jgi:type IV pilus assembly protein PilW
MRIHPGRREAGYTLIELMVAAAVAVGIAAAISAAFIGFNRMVTQQEGVRAGQSALRQSAGVLLQSLRLAGYGIEPELAFCRSTGCGKGAEYNNSDRLVFRYRDPRFGRALKVGQGTGNGQLALNEPLGVRLKAGQLLQVVCPGAVRWTYAELTADAVDSSQLLFVRPPATRGFPGGQLDQPCFQGIGAEPAYVFRIEEQDFGVIPPIDDDGDGTPDAPGPPTKANGTAPTPFLVRYLDTPEGPRAEPLVENVEALRVMYLRRDAAGNLAVFEPDPNDPRPDYDTPRNDPARTISKHPANIAAVRVGLVARSSIADPEQRQLGSETRIPAFGGRDKLERAPGFRRILFETTVPVRNMRSTGMFLPPFTADPAGCNGGTGPSDHLNCISG